MKKSIIAAISLTCLAFSGCIQEAEEVRQETLAIEGEEMCADIEADALATLMVIYESADAEPMSETATSENKPTSVELFDNWDHPDVKAVRDALSNLPNRPTGGARCRVLRKWKEIHGDDWQKPELDEDGKWKVPPPDPQERNR